MGTSTDDVDSIRLMGRYSPEVSGPGVFKLFKVELVQENIMSGLVLCSPLGVCPSKTGSIDLNYCDSNCHYDFHFYFCVSATRPHLSYSYFGVTYGHPAPQRRAV